MSTSRHSILFLSGAGLPAWIWDDVRDRLGASYTAQVAPRPEGGAAGLRDYAEAALGSMPAGRVLLVAHSAGGVVGAEIAALAPERVGGFLAISAIVPPPGGSFVTAMPIPNRWILSAAMRLAGTRPPDSAIRKTLATGVDEATIDRLIADFTPESQGYYRDRLGQQRWTGPRGYVTTTRDREVPPPMQRRFARRLGADWHRELATGHLPMLEDPGALTAAIVAFVESPPTCAAS